MEGEGARDGPVEDAVCEDDVGVHLGAFFLRVLGVDQAVDGGDEFGAPGGEALVDLLGFGLEAAFLLVDAEVEGLLEEAVDVP